MIILHVQGDDYAAMAFEQNYDVDSVYKTMAEEGCNLLELDADDCYITVKLLRFDIVDEHFFDFVKQELIDYDAGKSENIYMVGRE